VIEPTPDHPELDQARRTAVFQELAAGQLQVPAERVVIGYATTRGLDGVEAELIYQNLLYQTQNRGLLSGSEQGIPASINGGTGNGGGASAFPSPQ
jgi:hypothetical protein